MPGAVARAKIEERRTTEYVFRPARVEDIEALVDVENRCFDSDRLTRRSFQWTLTKGNATTIVAETQEGLVGYILVLYHGGTSLARMYSLAVLPEYRGQGIARRLVADAESAARDRDCVYMRLEVRSDNDSAIRFYESASYKAFGTWPDYYEDHMEARRYQKRIKFESPRSRIRVPFYAQTTYFTCGSAALMMAMKAHDPGAPMDKGAELQIWREATTIFMTSGHGGCGPHGLALAAWRRGFPAEIYVSDPGPLFLDGVRDEDKKAVMRLVHDQFVQETQGASGLRVYHESLTVDRIADKMEQGGVPIVLISLYQMHRRKSPHWLVLTATDSRFIYAHDPAVEVDMHKTATDCINVPIARQHFSRMAQYGRTQLKAAVIVYPPRRSP
jgi:ribosomal protein S18 acetylase RimI-like enzyme